MRARISGLMAAALCAVIIVCGVVIFAPLSASAQTAITTKSVGQTAVLSWIAPTQYTNGASFASGVVVSYNVYESSASPCIAFTPSSTALIASSVSNPSFTIAPYTAVGSYCYEVTAMVAGVESAPSNVVGVSVSAAIPKAPANLTAQ